LAPSLLWANESMADMVNERTWNAHPHLAWARGEPLDHSTKHIEDAMEVSCERFRLSMRHRDMTPTATFGPASFQVRFSSLSGRRD
jgi:hypothetical protein